MCGHDLPGCLFSMKLDSGTPKIKKNVFLRVFCGVEYSTGYNRADFGLFLPVLLLFLGVFTYQMHENTLLVCKNGRKSCEKSTSRRVFADFCLKKLLFKPFFLEFYILNA
jgi:hypothetical protein